MNLFNSPEAMHGLTSVLSFILLTFFAKHVTLHDFPEFLRDRIGENER